uniref:Uncharacterized protein n=1 Tax=Sphaerodactylus townsendi TaxID=933632 RepID=A0ACB8EXS7_9SAUR
MVRSFQFWHIKAQVPSTCEAGELSSRAESKIQIGAAETAGELSTQAIPIEAEQYIAGQKEVCLQRPSADFGLEGPSQILLMARALGKAEVVLF